MPSDFCYRDDSDVYVTVYWGSVSILDILETILKRARDSDLKAARAHIVDLSNAVWQDTPQRQVNLEMERLRPAFAPPKIRTAFVTPGEFFYGLTLMYALMEVVYGEFFYGLTLMYALMEVVYGAAKVEVYRTWDAASGALEIPLASAESWARDRSRADH